MDKNYWKNKKREQRAKANQVTVAPVPLDPELKVSVAYDREKYPNKKAFEIAVERSERAKRYAVKFPNLIGSDDLKFQTLDWQYRNEGLKVPAS